MNQAYKVKLDAFEGPLDLLLHLIKQFEIDIYDIPVAEITKQYTDYIHAMQKLELNIASEYLVMAATLVSIKSQMLLPKQEIDEEFDDYMADPREELVQRLIEYKKYKEAADKLEEKETDTMQLFTRSPIIFKEVNYSQVVEKGDISIYDMLGALNKMLQRKKWENPLESKIYREEIPIEQRMDELMERVRDSSSGISFDQLFPYESRSHIVITFIALLELMKENYVYCKQTDHLGSLYIFPHKPENYKNILG